MMGRPEIVCLCGSTRFRGEYEQAFRDEEHAGRICLTEPCYKDDPCCKTRAEQRRLDTLHRAKIDMADEILVINVGGYIGDSTKAELAYCWRKDKRVRFLDPAFSIKEEPCEYCNNRRTVQGLGCGGDYETYSCPKCRAEEHARQVRGY